MAGKGTGRQAGIGIMAVVGAAGLAAVAGASAWAALGGAPSRPGEGVVVSQASRIFAPSQVALERGGNLTIVNDDGNVIHHAYVDSGGFRADSGDQAPSSRTTFTFPEPGEFQVLCGIHPKMRLDVKVR